MPLSNTDKENILNRLRSEYDVLTPGKTPPDTNATIALLEQSLECHKGQVAKFLAREKKDATEADVIEYQASQQKIIELEWRIPALRKPNWMKRSLSFAENTQMDVEQIVRDGLNRNVKDQDKRYREYRESYGLTYEELATIIGVHRKNITRLETPKSSSDINAGSTVDPFYLEALALIYYEDPYTLLGLKPALISPLRYERTTHADYIMNTLTAYPNNQMEKYLQTFRKIAMLTKGQFDLLCQIVNRLPAFTRLKEHKANIRCEQRFLQNPTPFNFPFDKRDSPEYKRAELIQSVFFELKALDIKSHYKLRQLALWASGGENILEIPYALLILGEYPERKDSLQPSASDKEYDFISLHYVASRRRDKAATSEDAPEQQEDTEQTIQAEPIIT